MNRVEIVREIFDLVVHIYRMTWVFILYKKLSYIFFVFLYLKQNGADKQGLHKESECADFPSVN